MFATLFSYASAEEPDYTLYGKALRAHVSRGSVNYTALARDKGFKTFVSNLKKFDRSKLRTTKEKKAFYINLYNALTLDLVASNMPVTSIKKISRPWAKKLYVNGGDKFSLDHIEHKILRPMGDYRIHFAINCASIGCPDLRAEPYTSAKLSRQLGEQMKLFLADKRKGVNVGSGGVATVSKIFKWFKKDFAASGGVLSILQKRHTQGSSIKSLKYSSYNWNLNGK